MDSNNPKNVVDDDENKKYQNNNCLYLIAKYNMFFNYIYEPIININNKHSFTKEEFLRTLHVTLSILYSLNNYYNKQSLYHLINTFDYIRHLLRMYQSEKYKLLPSKTAKRACELLEIVEELCKNWVKNKKGKLVIKR